MKKFRLFLIVALFAGINLGASAQEKSTWIEQDNFHGIMSKTFHPSEEGNLNPLKLKSDSLVIIAKQWKVASIPATYKSIETAEAIAKLLKQCKAINGAVKEGKADSVLTTMIKEAHDTFHYIVGECKKHD